MQIAMFGSWLISYQDAARISRKRVVKTEEFGESIVEEIPTATKVSLLEERIKALELGQSRLEFLASLAPSTLRLLKNIPVSIAYNDDDYIATFFDAGISTTGDTPQEAMWNIADLLILKFHRLSEIPECSLGSGPKRQLAVLREFISKV